MTPYTSAANQWSPARKTVVGGGDQGGDLPALPLATGPGTTAGVASQGQCPWALAVALLQTGPCLASSGPQFPKEHGTAPGTGDQ